MISRHPPIDFNDLPARDEDWRVGVIVGPTGSGKSAALETTAKHYAFAPAETAVEVKPSKAICSYEELHGGDATCLSAKFQAVAMHSLPTRVKPFSVLSQGEQERFVLATALKEGQLGSIQDNRFAMVDAETAQSMCTGLHRYLNTHHCGRMLLATVKTEVVPFLQPDFVIQLTKEKAVVHRNPHYKMSRPLIRPEVSIETEVDGFQAGSGGGWRGPPSSVESDLWRQRQVPGAAVREDYSVEVELDQFTAEVAKAFDYSFTGKTTQKVFRLKHDALSTLGPWSCGAILGPSGSGKSTNLRSFGGSHDLDDAALDAWNQLPCSDQKLKLLEVVTLPSSTHQRRVCDLSCGERSLMRLAHSLAVGAQSGTALVDEFTSLLDRQRAYQVCCNLHGYLKSQAEDAKTLRLVVAGCHNDISGWLKPDWVFNPATGDLLVGQEDRDLPAPKPPVVSFEVPQLEFILKLVPSTKQSIELFHQHFAVHHYMEGAVPPNFYGLVLRSKTNNELVGFNSVSTQPGAIRSAMREARLVVLPRWQGHGIGPKISALTGAILNSSGLRYFCKTSQEALGMHRSRSSLWRPTSSNLKPSLGSLAQGFKAKKAKRKACQGDAAIALQLSSNDGAALPSPPVLVAKPKEKEAETEVEHDPECRRCQYDQKTVRPGGRPPKHTCGRIVQSDVAVAKEPKKCEEGEYDPDCRRCEYEQKTVRPGGRPPKHTCGRIVQSERPSLPNDVKIHRICYSHEYIGPPRKRAREGQDEDQAHKFIKLSLERIETLTAIENETPEGFENALVCPER